MLPGYGCLDNLCRPTLPEVVCTNSSIESERVQPGILPHVSSSPFPISLYTVPMSPPTLGSRSSAILGPITPTVDLTPHAYPSTKPAFETTGSCWTVPLRDGLPTPPCEMTGVAYNAIPSAAYGAKTHGVPSHLYSHSRPHLDSFSSSVVASMKTNHLTTHSAHAPAKEVPATEPTSRKNSTGKARNSVLRIPSSINDSKGSLAEFAAQVRAHRNIAVSYCRITANSACLSR